MELGKYSYSDGPINNSFSVLVTVGNFTSIGKNLTIFGGKGQHPPIKNPKVVTTYPFFERHQREFPHCEGRGDIVIGSDVWIGGNVILIDGITIGNGAVIGVGAVVAKDIPDYAVVVGNPARIIRNRFDDETIKKLLDIKWWDWEDHQIFDNLDKLTDIDLFLGGNNE